MQRKRKMHIPVKYENVVHITFCSALHFIEYSLIIKIIAGVVCDLKQY